jgi:F0F1-type ATP synthase assembly protein I
MESALRHVFGIALSFVEGSLAPLLAVAVSVIYFCRSPQTEPIMRRIAASAHGIAIALIYVGALSLNFAHLESQRWSTPFSIILLLPLMLIVLFVLLFRGHPETHWFQLLNLLCLAWTAFIGGMAVTGDWL